MYMQLPIDVENINKEFLIHYGGELHSVEATTFSSSLICLTKIIEEISYTLYPDFKIEVRLEALEKGSFRPKIILISKSIISEAKSYLPGRQATIPTMIALFSLLQQCQDGSGANIKIEGDNNTVIIGDENKIEVAKETYENAKKISESKSIKQNLSQHFELVKSDSSITNFGFVEKAEDKQFLFFTDRKNFDGFIDYNLREHKRVIIHEGQNLQLLKIILEKGLRKWEFVWNGIKIGAPVIDDDFWEKMRRREISITQGDGIVADLKIYQVLDPYSNIYINQRYEIENIKDHTKALNQTEINYNNS